MKKAVSVFLVLCLAATSALSVEVKAAGSFSDVQADNTYFEAVTYLKQEGIIKGNPDGTFKPFSTLNRAEFVAIIVRSEHFIQDGCSLDEDIFPDVERDQWYTSYICYAHKYNLVEGYPDGTFRPTAPISFVEAAKILTIQDHETMKGFPTSSPWYVTYAEYLEENNAIPTSITGLEKKISRGEMAEMLYRMTDDIHTSGKTSLSYEKVAGLPDPLHTYVNTDYGFTLSIPDDLKNYTVKKVKETILGGDNDVYKYKSAKSGITIYNFSIPSVTESDSSTPMGSLYIIPNEELIEFQQVLTNAAEQMKQSIFNGELIIGGTIESFLPEFLIHIEGYAVYKDPSSTHYPISVSTPEVYNWVNSERLRNMFRDTITSTRTVVTSEAFTLTSSNEQLEIVGITGSGYCEGDRLYKGTYTLSIGSSSLNIGEHIFLGGGKNACNTSNEEQRKVYTIPTGNGKLYGFVYSQSYKASKVIAVVYDPQNTTLKQVKFYDENGKLYHQNLSDPNDTGIYYSDYSKAIKKDQYITFHTYPCCGSAGFYGEKYFQPADNDPSVLIFRKFTSGKSGEDSTLLDGGIIEETEPQDAALATVYRFYKALRYANGEKAVQEVISEKRETGAYKAKDISDTYSSWNLAIALRLTELKKVDATTVSVSYNYATDTRTCEDNATVTLRQEGSKFFIEKIVPEKGC